MISKLHILHTQTAFTQCRHQKTTTKFSCVHTKPLKSVDKLARVHLNLKLYK